MRYIKCPYLAKLIYIGYIKRCECWGYLSGTGTAYLSEAPDFTSCFSGNRISHTFVFCVFPCKPLVVPFGHCIACPSVLL